MTIKENVKKPEKVCKVGLTGKNNKVSLFIIEDGESEYYIAEFRRQNGTEIIDLNDCNRICEATKDAQIEYFLVEENLIVTVTEEKIETAYDKRGGIIYIT